MLIDLDYFKHINDTMGHIAGDHLLQILGQRFSDCFKDEIIVARLGGDEFAIIVPHLTDEAELFEIAKQLGNSWISRFAMQDNILMAE
ncbi:GGDEF domain-containing protein [Acinetobacter terrae]|uniref:GGDEF domain-containing protein n=1 Tax=Acinetobacter terrae TaxID=2731247 RepID=UPI001D17D4E0|nr:GGDEF domain-containing protein [Acinetobacter terrae]